MHHSLSIIIPKGAKGQKVKLISEHTQFKSELTFKLKNDQSIYSHNLLAHSELKEKAIMYIYFTASKWKWKKINKIQNKRHLSISDLVIKLFKNKSDYSNVITMESVKGFMVATSFSISNVIKLFFCCLFVFNSETLGLKCVCNPNECETIRSEDCPGRGLIVWDPCR